MEQLYLHFSHQLQLNSRTLLTQQEIEQFKSVVNYLTSTPAVQQRKKQGEEEKGRKENLLHVQAAT